MSKKVVIITTSHDQMGDSNESTGLWLEELSTPYYLMHDAGLHVDVCSISGGKIPIDPRSTGDEAKQQESVQRILKDTSVQRKLENSHAITDLDLTQYDALFLAGGHGTMWDFPKSEVLAASVAQQLQEGRVVAAVCHGPAGLVSATTANGTPIVKGKKIAAFTNSEEQAVGLKDAVPFLLEDKFKALGANYVKGPDFEPFIVVDGPLITGQNPPSAEPVAKKIIEKLLG